MNLDDNRFYLLSALKSISNNINIFIKNVSADIKFSSKSIFNDLINILFQKNLYIENLNIFIYSNSFTINKIKLIKENQKEKIYTIDLKNELINKEEIEKIVELRKINKIKKYKIQYICKNCEINATKLNL